MSKRILVVDDEAAFRQLYDLTLREAGFRPVPAASAEEALELLSRHRVDMVVSDVRMPGRDGLELLREVRRSHGDLPFLLVTAFADVRGAVEALRLGAVDYLSKPVDLEELLAAVRDQLGDVEEESATEVPLDCLDGIVARSPVMEALLRDAYRVARSDVTVLLSGESGTGKEVLARFLHRASLRHAGPLVAVNCAAIPEQLLGSELFGHQRGAFTGAEGARKGRFREAAGGTLFLDEIGDMSLELQPALLRALETHTITPLGSDREVEVDYRLVAATHRDLVEAVDQGAFRQDLYYRLNVITLEIPPLRKRVEDILPLARHFLALAGGEERRLSRAVQEALVAYPWPGNVRELSNAMQRAQLLARTRVVLPEHLPPVVRRGAEEVLSRPPPPPTAPTPGTGAPEDGASDPAGRTLEEIEREAVRQALERCGGNRTRTAEELGVSRRGLINKIKRFGL